MLLRKPFLFLLLMLCVGKIVSGQNPKINTANDLIKVHEYKKAVKILKRKLNEADAPRINRLLGDCYLGLDDPERAEKHFEVALEQGNLTTKCLMGYGKALQKNGKYEQAIDQFQLAGKKQVASGYLPYLISCQKMKVLDDRKSRFKVDSLMGKKTPLLGRVLQADSTEYTISKKSKKRWYGQGETAFSYDVPAKVFAVSGDFNQNRLKGANLKMENPYGFAIPIDMNTIVYSIEKLTPAKVKVRRICMSTLKYGIWSEPKELLPADSIIFSSFEPTYCAKTRSLVFVSNRPGGEGKLDLWEMKWSGSDWGQPEKLGSSVNTDEDERFPAYSDNGLLSFASTGHSGLGNFDLFLTSYDGITWESPFNPGSPLNSAKNDFGMAFSPGKNLGWYTSDRSGTEGLYRFELTPEVEINAINQRTKKTAKGVRIVLQNPEHDKWEAVLPDSGKVAFSVKPRKHYKITSQSKEYLWQEKRLYVNRLDLWGRVYVNLELEEKFRVKVNGRVFDPLTGEPVAGAKVWVKDGFGEATSPVFCDSAGNYRLITSQKKHPLIFVEATDYLLDSFPIQCDDKTESFSVYHNFELKTSKGMKICGIVKDYLDPEVAVQSAKVVLIDKWKGEEVALATSNQWGFFSLPRVDDDYDRYLLIVSCKDYFSKATRIVNSVGKAQFLNLDLDPIIYNWDSIIGTVYYNYNGSDLRLESQVNLRTIGYMMELNSLASLEVSSFTDCRGSSSYNRTLSRNRSKSVIDYVKSQTALPSDRFVAIGYGEDRPSPNYKGGKNCTEDQHQTERRSELRIFDVSPSIPFIKNPKDD